MGGFSSRAEAEPERLSAESPPGRSAAGTGPKFPEELWDHIDHRHFTEIDSTQTYVENEHESFNPSKLTAISAEFQTAGRGTRDRRWEAHRGDSVLVTFFFRFPPECSTPFVNRNVPNSTKVLAVAAVETLRWAAEEWPQEGSSPKFGIKWPNDIVADGKKLGGILARAVPSPGARLDGVILGVGVNVNTPQEELDKIHRPVWPASSLRVLTGAREAYDVAAIREHLICSFATELKAFFEGGFPAFRERVNGLEVFMGTQVRFRVSESQEVNGTFEGVDDDGLIMLRLADGSAKSYPSGEIIPQTPPT